MKEYVNEQLANAKKRIQTEKNRVQIMWRTEIKAPTGWFFITKMYTSDEKIHWLKGLWKSNEKNPAHTKAFNLIKNTFRTLEFLISAIAALIFELILAALRVIKNIGTLYLDLGRTAFAGIGLLVEGVVWAIASAGNAIIDRLPSAKKPVVQEQTAPAKVVENCAEKMAEVKVSLDEKANEVQVSANVGINSIRRQFNF